MCTLLMLEKLEVEIFSSTLWEDSRGKNTIAPICLSNENVKEVVYDSEAFRAGKYMNYKVYKLKATLISPIFM